MAQEIDITKRGDTRESFPPVRYEQAKEALARLAEIGRTLRPIDAVALVHEGRDLLDERLADDGR